MKGRVVIYFASKSRVAYTDTYWYYIIPNTSWDFKEFQKWLLDRKIEIIENHGKSLLGPEGFYYWCPLKDLQITYKIYKD